MIGLNMRDMAIVLSIATIALLSGQQALAEVCNGDLTRLGALCTPFSLKPGPQKDPSPECCNAIKIADVPCICKNIPPGHSNTISLEKVVYIWKFCGRPLKSGMKCGDFTIPQA